MESLMRLCWRLDHSTLNGYWPLSLRGRRLGVRLVIAVVPHPTSSKGSSTSGRNFFKVSISGRALHKGSADVKLDLAGSSRRQAPNSKLQAPEKHQVPNTKDQAPNSREAPSSKRGPRFGAWNLGFLWCLELGFWCFDSGTSLGLGVWCLVFRSAVDHKLKCAQSRR